jgi:adenine-specific DNA-methyltransferase
MKYMGSKRNMLHNGLGTLIRHQVPQAERVVDLFSGSGSVVFYVAEKYSKPVLAVDLQEYATILSRAIIGRTKAVDAQKLNIQWIELARRKMIRSGCYKKAILLKRIKNIAKYVSASRKLCDTPSSIGPIWNAYGGHYYSPEQAISFDYLLKTLPKKEPYRSVCLSSLISAASKCAAAPGHTAQPFQPTKTAGKFIQISWSMNPFEATHKALQEIAPRHAKVKGSAISCDANSFILNLKSTDLVIVDPPYSDVQYSRFYHVLETFARGKCGAVTGRGRYPDFSERPQSSFSNIGKAKEALDMLLRGLVKSKARVIFTFPKSKCSNGLSGELIERMAEKYFTIKTKLIHGKFSTLGGNNKKRDSRKISEELLLLLVPKK